MVRIAVIDSGVNLFHPQINKDNILGINFVGNDKKNFEDNLGHGTAIVGILQREITDAEFIIIKIFDNNYETDIENLYKAFQYLKKNNVNIIHLSNGIPKLDDHEKLKKFIDYFEKENTIIISACDNFGCNTYPAVFDNVISVDSSSRFFNSTDFEYIENSLTNIKIKGGLQRVFWSSPLYMIMSGASFSAPYITAIIAKLKNENMSLSFFQILQLLKERAKVIVHYEKEKLDPVLPKIKRAIIFPFNKEVFPLLKYKNFLNFKVLKIFSHNKLGITGRKLSTLIDDTACENMIVESYTKIDWNGSFDTVILGHMSEISNLINENLLEYFIDKCITYKKTIISFDSLEKYEKKLFVNNVSFYYPHLDKRYVPKGRDGRLFLSSKPVVGVFGTSSKQGKFAFQLLLREKLKEAGYKVGQLGTEPSSLLFGFDKCVAYGYNSHMCLSDSEFILKLNDDLMKIEEKKNDIIIVGTQGGVIPFSAYNINSIPMHQENFFSGIDFDIIFLCINPFDPIDYIIRSIKYIESYSETKVVSLILFPYKRILKWSLSGDKYEKIDTSSLYEIKANIEEKTSKKVFINTFADSINEIVDKIIQYFSE